MLIGLFKLTSSIRYDTLNVLAPLNSPGMNTLVVAEIRNFSYNFPLVFSSEQEGHVAHMRRKRIHIRQYFMQCWAYPLEIGC